EPAAGLKDRTPEPLEREAEALTPRVARGLPARPSAAPTVAVAAKTAHAAPEAGPEPHGRPRPLRPDVAARHPPQAPAPLPLASPAQTHGLQERLDIAASNAEVRHRAAAVEQDFISKYPLDPRGFGETREKLEHIESELRPFPAGPD